MGIEVETIYLSCRTRCGIPIHFGETPQQVRGDS